MASYLLGCVGLISRHIILHCEYFLDIVLDYNVILFLVCPMANEHLGNICSKTVKKLFQFGGKFKQVCLVAVIICC